MKCRPESCARCRPPRMDRCAPETRKRLRAKLEGARITVPPECDRGHVYHLFPVLVENRDAFQAHLVSEGVGTLVHYPVAIPRQPAMAELAPAVCPVADRIASQVVSLPLHPALTSSDLEFVSAAVQRWRP